MTRWDSWEDDILRNGSGTEEDDRELAEILPDRSYRAIRARRKVLERQHTEALAWAAKEVERQRNEPW